MERSKLFRKEDIGAGFRHIFYTMFHPFNGFDQVKWEDKGSVVACIVILLVFFLTNVFEQVLTGFIFNTFNPDKVSVPSIFLITMGGFAIVYIANWAAGSLQFSEGENRDVFITLCYTLVPSTFFKLVQILLTNFANAELNAFLVALMVIGYIWSGMILVVGLYYVHQFSFGGLLLNLLLTVIGVAIILFLLLLGYSLVQQIITFVVTIYNEIVFRL